VTFAKFMSQGKNLLDGVMDPKDKDEIVAGLAGQHPAGAVAKADVKAPSGPVDEAVKPEGVSAADAALNAPLGRNVASSSDAATEEEEDRLGLSIFQRVSNGYRRAFHGGRISLND
jgi:hypothetical protein